MYCEKGTLATCLANSSLTIYQLGSLALSFSLGFRSLALDPLNFDFPVLSCLPLNFFFMLVTSYKFFFKLNIPAIEPMIEVATEAAVDLFEARSCALICSLATEFLSQLILLPSWPIFSFSRLCLAFSW